MFSEQYDEESFKSGHLQQDYLLQVHLNEYRKLKDEQIARIIMREHMIYVTLGVFGGVSSYALHEGQYYAFLVIPWVCVILGWLYLTTDEKVSAIGEYIRHDLTEHLAKLTASPAEMLLLGWEIKHRSDGHRRSRKIFQMIIDQLTFVIPGLIALAMFWLKQFSFNKWFTIIWIIELVLLLGLGVLIVMTTDFKKGR
jgi:hypothetical protein